MQQETMTELATISADMTPASLKALGLNEQDIPEIQALAAIIKSDNPLSVSQFGREVAEHTSSYSDNLLDQVRNSDLDDAGTKLSEVVAVAQSLNVSALSNRRSRIPVIGPLIDKVKLRGKNVLGQFDTTREQIDKLIAEVDQTTARILDRDTGLESMFVSVRQEHRLLGIHIAAGKQRLGELEAEVSVLRANIGNDPSLLQQVADLDALISNLDKRIGDLIAQQQAAMQSLPMIRLIQNNNRMLVDKFHTIREITVPAWKRGFMVALSLNEQQNAVQLATIIDDTTNELMVKNAELLHRNSIESAKANQRLVIDVETLQKVQGLLIQTVEDVIKIHREGSVQRKNTEKQIHGMRLDLQKRLGRNGDEKVVH